MWYLWHNMDRNCEKDANGDCVYPEGQSPANIAKTTEVIKEDDDFWDM